MFIEYQTRYNKQLPAGKNKSSEDQVVQNYQP
jgi:hypothetical protein